MRGWKIGSRVIGVWREDKSRKTEVKGNEKEVKERREGTSTP